MQLLKYTEWSDGIGNWYVNDTSDLSSPRALWWAPARMLNISPVDYVQLLIERFHPDHIKYFEDNDVLIYSWRSLEAAREFKNWINAQARKVNFRI